MDGRWRARGEDGRRATAAVRVCEGTEGGGEGREGADAGLLGEGTEDGQEWGLGAWGAGYRA